ncbi:hypothetical protein [Rhodococcus olei]
MTDAADIDGDEAEPTIETRDMALDPEDERADPDMYPCMWNASAGFLFKAVLRAQDPTPPEYVTVPLTWRSGEPHHLEAAVAEWNMLWEAAQFRRRIAAAGDDLPPALERVADRGDINVVFVPRTRTRYHEYSPLFHLLPRGTVERHGLPLRARGQWPFLADWISPDRYLPSDFEARLSRAWAGTVWRT